MSLRYAIGRLTFAVDVGHVVTIVTVFGSGSTVVAGVTIVI